jgi:hypothetical protein
LSATSKSDSGKIDEKGDEHGTEASDDANASNASVTGPHCIACPCVTATMTLKAAVNRVCGEAGD